MDELGIAVAASEREIANGQTIGFVSGQRLTFGLIDKIVGSGIEDRERTEIRHCLCDSFGIADIKSRAFECANFKIPAAEFGAQLSAQLSASAEYNDFFCQSRFYQR